MICNLKSNLSSQKINLATNRTLKNYIFDIINLVNNFKNKINSLKNILRFLLSIFV